MIRPRPPMCIIADHVFDTALAVIVKSAAPQSIDRLYRQSSSGGGRCSGIRYTETAVLTALLVRFLMGRPYGLRGAMDTIGEFTPDQLTAVGMAGQDCTAIHKNSGREYKRFHRYWTLRMTPLDPDPDLQAKRMTNAEFTAKINARTDDHWERSRLADERLTTLINDLLFGSINTDLTRNYHGDVVVDETPIDTASPDGNLGTKPHRYRGASSISKYWIRDKDRAIDTTVGAKAGRQISKSGFGVGATFLSLVPRRDALHAGPTLFVGVAVHLPTGASISGLHTALHHAHRTGLASGPLRRGHWPLLTADMGYNAKNGFTELLLRYGYSPVVRYPITWRVSFPSAHPPGAPDGPQPGPIQYAGAFYCPAVLDRIKGHRTHGSEELLDHDNFRAHDRRLRAIYPFLMGHHSRPAMAPVRFGRPQLGISAPQAVKIRLVCPAAMGKLMCPLKPESLRTDTTGLPLAQPDWAAQAMLCCTKSSTTVTLTDDQLRMAQGDLVPGSWEHTLYFEAARSLTEQRFSQLKSDYVGSLKDLKRGPRRTPMIKIAIALAAVTVNIRAQEHHDPNERRTESIDIRMRQLTNDLGHPFARIPPRS